MRTDSGRSSVTKTSQRKKKGVETTEAHSLLVQEVEHEGPRAQAQAQHRQQRRVRAAPGASDQAVCVENVSSMCQKWEENEWRAAHCGVCGDGQ